MSIWSTPKSNYVATDEVLPQIFNELAENEKYLKELTDSKIRTDQVQDATITSTPAAECTSIEDDEVLSILIGKVRKWLAELEALAFRSTVGDAQITDVALSKVTGAHRIAGTGSYHDLEDKPPLGLMSPKDNVSSDDIISLDGTKVYGVVPEAKKVSERAGVQTSPGTIVKGIIFEVFKNSAIGLSVTSEYSHVMTVNPTDNATHGYAMQIAQNQDGVYRRYASAGNVWQGWVKLLFPSDLTQLESKVATNTTNIATNSSSISTNATNISTNASNITKITNGTTVVGKAKVLENQADAMTTNYTPAQYRSLYPNCTLVEKKNSSTIGLSIGNTVSMLLTIVPNNNWPVSQIAISTSYMYIRTEDTSSTWYAWQKIQLPSDVSSALTSINSSISSINSSINTLSSKDTSLQSSINSLSSSVSSLQTQINNMLNGTTTFTLLKANNINLV